MVLSAVSPSRQGGTSTLLAGQWVVNWLYDHNPAFISALTFPQLLQILLRRKPTCQIESELHYKSPVRQTTWEVARKTHALYCVLVGLSGLDKQPSVTERLKSDTSAPTPTVSHRSNDREEVALFA